MNDLKHLQRIGSLVILAIATCILTILLLAGRRVWVEVFKPPPFHFTQTEYAPKRGEVCPGDMLSWTPKLVVTRAPTLLVVARTVWSVAEQRTMTPDLEPKFFVWTELERGRPVTRATQYRVPPLPPGLYEVRSAATAFNSDASTYRVPFVVPSTCFEGGEA